MKLWSGRFEKGTTEGVDDFHSSIRFDSRMARQDILGSIAHATMLGEQGILAPEDAAQIVAGLQGILEDVDAGRVIFEVDAEDIHMNVEKILTQRIGDAGKRLHTGRSRNDQVALDTRMYVRDSITAVTGQLVALADCLLGLAEQHTHTVMPGYTHLQKAQPVTLAFHLMAYVQMLLRDLDRLADCQDRVSVMPLGSGALAATTYPLNRERVAKLLGFPSITANAMDAVSDRDYVIEYTGCLSLVMMHLSRFCEELVLWSTLEFHFIEIDDGYSTGSSIMPQKKNPDVAELIRGKTGRVYGDLMALLTVMKGLPLAYNKDMQEDKEALFDAIDTVTGCLAMFTGMVSTMKVNAAVMERGAGAGFTNATDAADYLVKHGLPFRQAHEIIGEAILYCIRKDKSLSDLSAEELHALSPLIGGDFGSAISLKTCVEGRDIPGGPSPRQVEASIVCAREQLTPYRT